MSDTITVRCWIIQERPNALLVSKLPQDRQGKEQAWLPRSVLEHITRMPEVPGQWREALIKMPEWLAIEKGLA